MNQDQIWSQVQEELRFQLAKRTYDMWLKNTSVVSADGGTFRIGVPSKLAKDWLEDRFSGLIQETLQAVTGSEVDIDFVISPSGHRPALSSVDGDFGRASENGHESNGNGNGVEPVPDAPVIPPSELNARFRFSSFVVGHNSQFAHAAAKAVAEAPGDSYNPLFLYGGVGLGKTHLMHAIGHRVRERNPSANVVYVSSEKFTNEFIIAIKNNQTVEFRNRYRHVDVLLIDDIQFLEGKEQTQEEFFHTFNSLHEAQKQLVISSDRPPKEIQTLENRLRSRFEWGLLTDIQPPDFETREAILRKKAETEKVPVPDEVLAFIAKVIPSNIRELEGSLIRVVAFASLTKSPIGVELAAEVLKNAVAQAPMHRVTIPGIKERVAKHYGISVKEMEAQRRDQRVTLPRQIAMYIAWQLTGASLPQIAREFGKKDHTTAMYARDKIADMMEADEAFRNKIRSLVAQIQSE